MFPLFYLNKIHLRNILCYPNCSSVLECVSDTKVPEDVQLGVPKNTNKKVAENKVVPEFIQLRYQLNCKSTRKTVTTSTWQKTICNFTVKDTI